MGALLFDNLPSAFRILQEAHQALHRASAVIAATAVRDSLRIDPGWCAAMINATRSI